VKNVGSAERPGIVHRLDKDTSGLMLVALSEKGYAGLTKMISEKSVTRKYLVAVYGVANRPFEVDAPIGRDPRNPTRMAVVPHGKNAYTRSDLYNVWKRLVCWRLSFSLVELIKLESI